MNKTKRKFGILIAAVALVCAMTCSTVLLASAAGDNVTTVSRSYTTDAGMTRAVKVESDSFTIDFQNDCGNAGSNWGFMFANSPDTSFNIGSGSGNALDLLIQGENFNVYNNDGWSECTSVLQGGQGAGWMLGVYSVNKPTHLTVSKATDGGIKLAVFSDGGNVWAQNGVDIAVDAWKNGKELRFDDLVDENGYTYWKVAANMFYPITVTDTWTVVSGINFVNVKNMDLVQLVGAYDEGDKPVYVADSNLSANGYELLAENVAKVEFTDGVDTVKVAVGEDVVFPSKNYSVNSEYKLGEITATNSDDRFSIGDSPLGMLEVKNNSLRFDLGIELTAAPTGNTNFNICIGPNTVVQAAGQNVANVSANTFSLFSYVTGGGRFAMEYYGSAWDQHSNTMETSDLTVGKLNRIGFELKKENGKWDIWVDGHKVIYRDEFDFDAARGDNFMNADGKVNVAIVGHNSPNVKVSLLGVKISVDADVTSCYDADFYADLKAYDGNDNLVAVTDAEVTDSGFSFAGVNLDAVKYVEIATKGGVVTKVTADVAGKNYAETVSLGDTEHDKTITVNDPANNPVSDVTLVIKEGDDVVSSYYEVVNNGSGSYTVRGVNKEITVAVSYTVGDKVASGKAVIGKDETTATLTLAYEKYSVVLQLLVGDEALEGMSENIKVYDADETEIDVEISYLGGKYVISGIPAGTAATIVFEADGYTSDSVNVTDEADVTIRVKQYYTVSFTVKAGENYLDDNDIEYITLKGANEEAELSYDEVGEKFVIVKLYSEVQVTISYPGYAEKKQPFDADNREAAIELTATTVAVDTSALEAAIASATQAKTAYTVSTDGSDVNKTDKYVTAQDVETLEAAIAAAQAVLNGTPTQAQVDEAKDNCLAAVAAFHAAAKNGTKDNTGSGSGDGNEKPSKKKGCGSVIGSESTAALAVVILAAAIVICLMKRKKIY